MQKPFLIIGIGNELRGDDAAGIIAARILKSKDINNAEVLESDGDGAKLMDRWQGYDNVIIIDAFHAGTEPGKIHTIKAGTHILPKESLNHTSHLFGAADAIETSRALNKLPGQIIIYGIEGKSYELGSRISGSVNKAINEVVEQIQKEISE